MLRQGSMCADDSMRGRVVQMRVPGNPAYPHTDARANAVYTDAFANPVSHLLTVCTHEDTHSPPDVCTDAISYSYPTYVPTQIPSFLPTKCRSDAECGRCRICQRGKCVPKRCPVGWGLDPRTCRCVPRSQPTSTYKPTLTPTFKPTSKPTFRPTYSPSYKPTFQPAPKPTFRPSQVPSYKPMPKPIFRPTGSPTLTPTRRLPG